MNQSISGLQCLVVTTAIFFAGAASAGTYEINFDAAVFSNPAVVDNAYWPLIPGTTAVYTAETEDGCVVNRVTVSSETKADFAAPYDGITAVVVEDLEWLSEECDGEYTLLEKTSDWFAQDDDSNVWYLGEETEAYEEDEECITGEGAWEAGVDGAEAGIVMLGSPKVGLSYQQEYYEDEAEDMARVLRLNAYVELESFGPFTDCLKTKEWTPLERGSIEHKFYCPQSTAGLVLIEELKGKTVYVEYIGTALPDGDFPEDLPAVGECPADE